MIFDLQGPNPCESLIPPNEQLFEFMDNFTPASSPSSQNSSLSSWTTALPDYIVSPEGGKVYKIRPNFSTIGDRLGMSTEWKMLQVTDFIIRRSGVFDSNLKFRPLRIALQKYSSLTEIRSIFETLNAHYTRKKSIMVNSELKMQC
jgi:hypothetical protein